MRIAARTGSATKYGRLRVLLRILILVSLGLTLCSCSAAQQTYGIRPTDLSWVRLATHRDAIEAKLGTGKSVVSRDAATFEFNRGYRPPVHGKPLFWPVAAAGWETLNLLSIGSRSYWEHRCQRAMLEVKFDSANRLVSAQESMIDLGGLNTGTNDICERIRANLSPPTLPLNVAPAKGE